ncbi:MULTISPECIES: TadE/TadG family type IV pilus assembly protein [Devosia]|jgi:Flp pilus assembly protein TadG|uniref:Pilus assembly protein n=1 Tax=Devosia litorisediminis TaxID=2829817 RepID=A0A942I594_9HYPH|nr:MULTISPECIES: TadE/TadG family type IV pilus assembly protein [Devosia]MBS3847148.1 pilus assembly protein [Devosia litorisediminis]MCZ4346521.1 pilus assembly protein [Devosia neptuniae]|tara:strand:- start:3111 stop:3635 length:525 start_codon:yes stop_codon:yes gene_type:complete
MITRIRRGFVRHQAGAAAVEFALIVPMLFALIFSTIEVGWTMVQTIMLERGLDLTVRSLRIGSLANPTQTLIRQAVCKQAMVLNDCVNTLTIELIPITKEADYPTDSSRCINRGSKVAPVLRFDAGSRSQTVFVRACFVVSPLTPGLGVGLALPKDNTGAYRIIAKSAFVNEPS